MRRTFFLHEPLRVEASTSDSLGYSVASAVSWNEARVLEALDRQHRLTFNELMHVTSLDGEQLRLALGGLHAKGLVARLQTVVESWCRSIAAPAPLGLQSEEA